jgi:hypothetical protein
MKRKLSTETPVYPREHLVIISYTTGLSFALERIRPLAAISITVFYLLILYLLALPNTPENLFASIYSESLIKTACQHLLLLVGFDTLIYRKYYDTPLILVGHQGPTKASWLSWVASNLFIFVVLQFIVESFSKFFKSFHVVHLAESRDNIWSISLFLMFLWDMKSKENREYFWTWSRWE